jgi:hypothetical protein
MVSIKRLSLLATVFLDVADKTLGAPTLNQDALTDRSTDRDMRHDIELPAHLSVGSHDGTDATRHEDGQLQSRSFRKGLKGLCKVYSACA